MMLDIFAGRNECVIYWLFVFLSLEKDDFVVIIVF